MYKIQLVNAKTPKKWQHKAANFKQMIYYLKFSNIHYNQTNFVVKNTITKTKYFIQLVAIDTSVKTYDACNFKWKVTKLCKNNHFTK